MDVGALMGALWARALRIVVVTLLLLAASFVVLMFVPKMYESSAGLLIEDRSNSFTQVGTTPAASSGVTIDALTSSQIELIKSRDTLLAVVDSQNLRSVPEFSGATANPLTALLSLVGRKPEPRSVDETALQNLNDRLTVSREGNSAVISIYVRSTDAKLAAGIANAIAAEHVKRRANQSVTDTAEATVWLRQQIDSLRQKVQEADTRVADYRAKNGIFAGSNGTTLPDQQISDIGRQITDAQQRKNTAEQRADLIRSLIRAGQPADGIDDVRNSAVISSLLQSRAGLQSQLAEKLATLLPAHPVIIALNAQIVQINAQIKAEARHVADGLDSQVAIETGLIQSLEDNMAQARLSASTQTRDTVTLDSLTREAKAQRDLLDGYLLKYRDASGRTDTGSVLPDVRIISQAAPSVVPASPKMALVLSAVGFIAVVLQSGAVLFGEILSGRAVYDRGAPHHDTEPEFVAAENTASLEVEPDFADTPDDPLEGTPVVVAPPRAAKPAQVTPPGSVAEPRHAAIAGAELALSNLSADICIGRVRVVFLAGISDARDAAMVADRLVGDALSKGLSVCRVDAGSMRISSALGITDLCAGPAGFGDVVHRVSDGLAEVPWGQLATLERRSMRPVTLVEALVDIYEVVIVSTGRIGLNSSLPVFAGAKGRLVTVRQSATPAALVDAAAADAAALGFAAVECVMAPELQTAVA